MLLTQFWIDSQSIFGNRPNPIWNSRQVQLTALCHRHPRPPPLPPPPLWRRAIFGNRILVVALFHGLLLDSVLVLGDDSIDFINGPKWIFEKDICLNCLNVYTSSSKNRQKSPINCAQSPKCSYWIASLSPSWALLTGTCTIWLLRSFTWYFGCSWDRYHVNNEVDAKSERIHQCKMYTERGVLSDARFFYVFPCELRGPAWAIGSYSISQSAGGTSQNIIFKTLRQIGRPALYNNTLKMCGYSGTVRSSPLTVTLFCAQHCHSYWGNL